MEHLKVRDLMTRKVVTLRKEQSLTLADELMRLERVRHLPVVDDDQRLVGLVTHRDLLAAHLSTNTGLNEEERTDLQLVVPVERIMTRDVWSVRPDASAVDTAQLLCDNRFGCAPVVDDARRVIGIITEADFMEGIIELLASDDSGIEVRDLMTTDVVSLNPGQSLSAAEDMMMLRRIRHLPVIDDDGGLIGLVTHRDLLAAQYSVLSLAPKFPPQATARDVMRAEVWTVAPDAPAADAARMLEQHSFGCLPVLDGEAVVGIVTEADFLAFLVQCYGPSRRQRPRTDAPVHHYLRSPVRAVGPDDDLDRVQDVLDDRGISCAAVIDEFGNLLGVVSRTDLMRVSMARLTARRHMGARRLPHRRVGEIMTRDLVTVRLDDSVAHAAQLMVEHDVHRVFVTEGDRPLGVFSTTDAMAVVRDVGVSTPVRSFMTSVIFAVTLDEPVSAGVKLLDKADVSGVVVLDGRWPVGLFTQREALASRHLARDTPIEYAMTQAFISVPGSMPLYRAAGQAAALDVHHVVVFDDGSTEGVLTGMDFARACLGDVPPPRSA
ncbi:CBS domain-containing protein [Haliangium sp.]|uniref:CBS domain-containing protein n=1 Tax=Haliangium sp. TaxID=2663208 RepID=UPI003D09AB91